MHHPYYRLQYCTVLYNFLRNITFGTRMPHSHLLPPTHLLQLVYVVDIHLAPYSICYIDIFHFYKRQVPLKAVYVKVEIPPTFLPPWYPFTFYQSWFDH